MVSWPQAKKAFISRTKARATAVSLGSPVVFLSRSYPFAGIEQVAFDIDGTAVIKEEAGVQAELLEFDDLFHVDDHLISSRVCLEFCEHGHLDAPAALSLYLSNAFKRVVLPVLDL